MQRGFECIDTRFEHLIGVVIRRETGETSGEESERAGD
jgi:hypothetical protein